MLVETMNLTAADLAMFDGLRISRACLARQQLARVDDRTARELLALNGRYGPLDGLVFAYFDPIDGHVGTRRLRRDTCEYEDGKPKNKYVSAYGDHRHVYFPVGAGPLLPDPSIPVVVVEAEKSVLALWCAAERSGRRILPIGLGGCWSWRGRIGKTVDAKGERVDEKGPLPDFHRITWADRDVIVLFDARPNASVQAARRQFAGALTSWGAIVTHAHLPDDDLCINGPDDLVGCHGDAALWEVLDGAVPDFKRNKHGVIIENALENIRLALAQLRVHPVYDAFRREIRIQDQPLDDVALDVLWIAIDDTFHWRPPKSVLYTVIIGKAHDAPVHPIREYLDGLVWDGTPRLDRWLVDYGGAIASPYVEAVGALVLVAAVRRVRRPGCKFDELLVLESAQGTLKSSALRALCPADDWFSDDLPLGVDSKITIERTAGKWIIEAAELHGNRGREAEQLKSFLSRQVDGPVRLAYGRLPTTVPRQFVIIGSTNARLAYLKDQTGGRRFWPVTIQRFDVDAIEADRDQLWAEAAAREATGESIRLPTKLWKAAGEQQERRRAEDPWEAILEPLLVGDGIVSVEHVAVDAIWTALGMEANCLDNRHADRVAVIVQRYGFTKGRAYINGKRQRCWLREATADEPDDV